MAFDFPTSPAVGTIANGYIWDGEKWKVLSGANTFAQLDAYAFSGMQVNGNMEIAQELGTAGATLASGVLKFIVDAWQAYYASSVGVVVSAQVDVVSYFGGSIGCRNAMVITATTGAPMSTNQDCAFFRTILEQQRIARLSLGFAAAQPFSYGFWFYGGVAGTLMIRVGIGTKYYYQEKTTNAGWTWVTGTIQPENTLATAATHMTFEIFVGGKGASLVPALDVWGNTAYVQSTNLTNYLSANNRVTAVTGFIVFPGTDIIPQLRASFSQRPLDYEMRLCLRQYYSIAPGVLNAEHIAGGMASATQGYYPIAFPVIMRAAPTGSVSSAAHWNNNPFVSGASIQPGTSVQFAGISPFGCRFGITSATTGLSGSGFLSILDAANAAAKINFDARIT